MDYDDDTEFEILVGTDEEILDWIDQRPKEEQKFYMMEYLMERYKDDYELDTTSLLAILYQYVDYLHRIRNVELGSSPH